MAAIKEDEKKALSRFAGYLVEFTKGWKILGSPSYIEFIQTKAETPKTKDEIREIIQLDLARVASKRMEATAIAQHIKTLPPKLLPVDDADKVRIIRAYERYPDNVERMLKCVEYHLDHNEAPAGLSSLSDCLSLVNQEKLDKFQKEVARWANDLNLYGYIRDMNYGEGVKEEPTVVKKTRPEKKEDFFKWRGMDWQEKIQHLQTDPKYKHILHTAPSAESIIKQNVEHSKELAWWARRIKAIEVASRAKRYNQLLSKDDPFGLVLGAVVATKYYMGGGAKAGGAKRNPRVFFNVKNRWLAARNIPIFGVEASSEAKAKQLFPKLMNQIKLMRGNKRIDLIRRWAQFWTIASSGLHKGNHWYFVLWPTKYRAQAHTNLNLEEWAFNTKGQSKAVSYEGDDD